MKENSHRGTNRVMHMARPHYSKCNSHSKPGKIPVEFRCEAPGAEKVYLAGDFNDWRAGELRLDRDENGVWRIELHMAPGRYEYRLIVDGEWQDDPHAATRVPNQFGTSNCVLEISPPAEQFNRPTPTERARLSQARSEGRLQHA